MTAGLRVDPGGLSLPPTWTGPLDVELDGHRVFSTAVSDGRPGADGNLAVSWPRVLVPYLHGESEVTIRDHLTRAVLATQTVRFDDSEGRVSVTDDAGLRLSLSKWGTLRHTFTESGEAMGAHYLADLDRFFELTREIDVDAFVSYGTLLGAVRAGTFIGHDTDADVSYLSRYDTPAEIAAEGFRVERALRRHGWGTFRHSAGFMKVWAPGRTRADNFDVFTCYVVGDALAVDRWVRGPGSRKTVLPLTEVSLAGRRYPAPADPEALLELTYGPGWRIPDPTFRFSLSRSTRDRARGWLGGRRWSVEKRKGPEEAAVPAGLAAPPSDYASWIAPQLSPGDVVLQAGCRSGVDGVQLAQHVHALVGFDQLTGGLAHARTRAARAGVPATFEAASFYDLRHLVALGAEFARHARSGRGRVLLAQCVVETLRPEGRAHFWLLARTALLGGGRLLLELTSEVDELLDEARARGGCLVRRDDLDGRTRCLLEW